MFLGFQSGGSFLSFKSVEVGNRLGEAWVERARLVEDLRQACEHVGLLRKLLVHAAQDRESGRVLLREV